VRQASGAGHSCHFCCLHAYVFGENFMANLLVPAWTLLIPPNYPQSWSRLGTISCSIAAISHSLARPSATCSSRNTSAASCRHEHGRWQKP
jgi:hypothetical protein